MSDRPITDPRAPRRTPNPLRRSGRGRTSSCISCGGSFSIVGKVPKDELITCPHCGVDQEPER